jgi:hypothetical protein
VAHYDTFEGNNPFQQLGAWGVFPYKNGTRVLISDRNSGLYLFGFNFELFNRNQTDAELLVTPNFNGNASEVFVQISNVGIHQFKLRLVDLSGKVVLEQAVQNQSYANIQGDKAQGLYIVQVEFQNYLGETVFLQEKLLIE